MAFTNAISADRKSVSGNRWIQTFLVIFFSIWISTLIGTSDIGNWVLENALVIFFLIFLAVTYRYYQFSDLSYLLICLYLCLHVYGSKYTYAENPFGYWLQSTLGTARNPYDRLVHFSFGFLLAYPMREACLSWLRFPVWVSWALPIEITLSISGMYELIEWAVADLFFPAQGAAYLGTQGDIWDAQKDMALATLGAILATTIVSIIKKSFKIERIES
jgi:putative membrane protein